MLSPPSMILSTPELIISIAERVESRIDLSALNRCNRTIHEHTQRHLYRDLIVTKFNACSLAAAIRANSILPLYCRKLTVQHLSIEENLEEKQSQEFVVNECLMQGFLTDLTWSVKGFSSPYGNRLQIWAKLPLVSQTLRSLSVDLKCFGAQVALVSELTSTLDP